MDTKESLTQDPPPLGEHQAQPVQVLPAPPRVPAVAPTTPETLTPQELELIRQFRANSSRSSSPPRKAKLDPEPEWQEFWEALAVKNIELSDLDSNPQQELQGNSVTGGLVNFQALSV